MCRAGVRPDEAGAGAGVIAGTGPWPNPPTEAEQLQALIAAANGESQFMTFHRGRSVFLAVITTAPLSTFPLFFFTKY